jgi:peptidoglycan/xylan/chitin deacetylase (PgdA/CDA1 family)
MRRAIVAYCLLASLAGAGTAVAADCPGNPNALGTSRTLAVDPTEHPLLGVLNYRESLPLNDREVVLTFDDGPLPPYTTRVLDTLAAECVKATFFMVGRMASGYPNLVKRVYAEGHTLANHSQNHPFTFHKMSVDAASHEVENGFASIRTALGNPNGVSNFFRIPGLLRQESVERYLTSKGYQTWSVDAVADDWTHISSKEVVRRAIARLEAHGKGILLLHDIQPATAAGLPELLHELKVRGFKVVHVVQASAENPKTASLPEQWIGRRERPSFWPTIDVASASLPEPVLEAPNPRNFGIASPVDDTYPGRSKSRSLDPEAPLPSIVLWPRGVRLVALDPPVTTPAPAAENFRYSRVWQARTGPTRAVPRKHQKKDVATSAAVGSHGQPASTTSPRPKTAKDPNRQLQRPTGHQFQPSRPAASVPQQVGMR